jgi:hypothetical protein
MSLEYNLSAAFIYLFLRLTLLLRHLLYVDSRPLILLQRIGRPEKTQNLVLDS